MSYHGNNEIRKIPTKSIILLAKIQSGIKVIEPNITFVKTTSLPSLGNTLL